MLKKVFKLGILMVIMTLAVGTFTSAEEGTDQVKSLTVEQAVDLAMKNNNSILRAELAVDKAELSLDKAQRLADDLGDSAPSIPGMPGSPLEWAQGKELQPVMAEATLNINKKTLEFTKKNIKYAVEELYYAVVKAEKLLAIKMLSVQQAEEQLRLAELNYKVGRFAKVDVTSVEVLLAATRTELAAVETQYKVTKMNFNKLIGLDLDTQIKLTSDMAYSPIEVKDINSFVEKALADSAEVVSIKEQLRIKEKDYDLYVRYYSAGVDSAKERGIDLQDANLQLQEAETKMRLDVKAAYYQLKTSEQNIKVLEKALAKQEENLRLANLRYKVGIATNSELLDANVALEKARQDYTSAIYDYSIAKAKFENGIFSKM